MAITRDEALAALGLGEQPDPGRDAIQRAFERLARRYPPAAFPERFQRLIAARDLLLNEERYWQARVEGRTLDLSWTLPYLPKDPLTGLPRPSEREFLQDLLRAVYQEIPLEDEEDDSLVKALAKILGIDGR